MDLESTLVRAESLFKRFQRTVETIDKKGNFPSAPQARQRKSVAGPSNQESPSGDQATSSGTDKGKQVDEGDKEDVKVISSELRTLLSRQVEKLDKSSAGEQSNEAAK
jgi:TBC1 domain family member 15